MLKILNIYIFYKSAHFELMSLKKIIKSQVHEIMNNSVTE